MTLFPKNLSGFLKNVTHKDPQDTFFGNQAIFRKLGYTFRKGVTY